jgi:quercetin dioxygenase-like cupin family protein
MTSLAHCALAMTFALTVSASSQTPQPSAPAQERQAEMHLYPAAEIVWRDGPPSLPAGAKLAVLEGDPAKDGFFTMRLRLPDGYKIPPHWHPKVEHVTVISGTFNVGMGDSFDQTATRAMPAGTFGHWPADMRHFAWANGETVVQLHGIGPWTISYVNGSDDPRKGK